MARPRKPLDVHGEKNAVLKLHSKEPSGWRRDRLTAIKLGLEGELSLDQIAEGVGRSRSIIQLWFDAYRKGGVAQLLTKSSGRGRKSVITEQVMEEMKEKLQEGAWRTGGEALQWLKQRHGIEIHPNNIYPLLGKLGGRLKVPRPCHRRKDPQAAQAFKEELANLLESLGIPREKPIRVWVQDEMRYGLQPLTRRCWAAKGVRVVKEVWPRYDWGYVYGAVEVGGQHQAEMAYLPTVSKEATKAFLKQISKVDPESVHVLIWDGAGFHHYDGDPEIPENIRLLRLPGYSPELNPIEKLWDIVKDGICNRVIENLEEIEEALTEQLRTYWEDPGRVRSLIGNGWMLAKVNAT